jgi:hypothetical protein
MKYIAQSKRDRHASLASPLHLQDFSSFAGTVGLAGCLTGNQASLALGGVLMLYGGGVYCLRKGCPRRIFFRIH